MKMETFGRHTAHCFVEDKSKEKSKRTITSDLLFIHFWSDTLHVFVYLVDIKNSPMRSSFSLLFCPFSVRLSEVMKNEKTLWNNRKIHFLMNAFGIKCRRNSHFYPKYENIFVCSRYMPLCFGMVQGSFVYLEKWEGTSILNYKNKFGIRIKQH